MIDDDARTARSRPRPVVPLVTYLPPASAFLLLGASTPTGCAPACFFSDRTTTCPAARRRPGLRWELAVGGRQRQCAATRLHFLGARCCWCCERMLRPAAHAASQPLPPRRHRPLRVHRRPVQRPPEAAVRRLRPVLHFEHPRLRRARRAQHALRVGSDRRRHLRKCEKCSSGFSCFSDGLRAAPSSSPLFREGR